MGSRSFGPLLVLVGLIAMSPLSGIPGMPSTMGLLVIATCLQLPMGQQQFWLPKRLLDRSISQGKLPSASCVVRRPAVFVDRFVKPRLTVLTRGAGTYATAVACLLVAATMPPLELLPFAATAAGAVLTLFGLSLLASDGVLSLLGLTGFTAGAGRRHSFVALAQRLLLKRDTGVGRPCRAPPHLRGVHAVMKNGKRKVTQDR